MVSLGKTHNSAHSGQKSPADPARSDHRERYNSVHQTTDVNAQLCTFIDAIADCEEYRTFREASERLDKDEAAQQLLEASQRKQILLQRGGFDEELKIEPREVQSKMEDNETISEYRQAEEALIELLDRTNDVISDRVGEEFARTTGGLLLMAAGQPANWIMRRCTSEFLSCRWTRLSTASKDSRDPWRISEIQPDSHSCTKTSSSRSTGVTEQPKYCITRPK
ncbi:YlbF family regulator [Halodesulfurarchaeum sp.]|uniref:YlbF family regulator n=1 Tax=Halodesulfurarchaeum sp. TaxID=1980530 RepID=UPI002FC35BE0